MKKFLVFSLMVGCLAGVFAAEAASVPEPKVQAKAFGNYNDPDTPQPLDKWTFLQIVFLPNVPNSTWNSNVYGLKTGWVASGGVGRVFGLEVSWVYSGTDTINGGQASWVAVKSRDLNGLQAAFVTALNTGSLNGLQATGPYALAGDVQGAQFAFISQAKNFIGIQGGLALALSKGFTGFQAGAVSIADGPFTGVQCGFVNKAGEDGGALQLGLLNMTNGKGVQFGAINYNKDAWIPVFPILNFSF
ncbi:hypothetical protein [uncultured Victivallis sp.]|uniref:hypothetical protein n=1 Tax=uncultured Victivallis sp. TaxID=354118 RepID=UPI0025D34B18|nr:hypothetical protein [uncultured Victivallis sp.]